MQEVKAITHQIQVASLVSATAPAFAYMYVSSPGQLSENYETRYEAVHNNICVWTHIYRKHMHTLTLRVLNTQD